MSIEDILLMHLAAWSLQSDLGRLATAEQKCGLADEALLKAFLGQARVDEMPLVSQEWRAAHFEQISVLQNLVDAADLLELDA